MVYPNSNDFLHMPSMLDDNVAKLMNAEQQIENYLAAASPPQEYLVSPSYHPQEQQNQRQHQLQFPATMISHSAPNSPPYPNIKTEDAQTQNSVDYALMFPTTFDVSSQDQQILPSQRQFANVSLLQQHQQHKQQQQHHEQQLRLQHRQLQMMYDTIPSHSAVTSSIMSSMVSAATSNTLFAPTAIATSAPFVHAPILTQDTLQRRPSYVPAPHPAAPKRKREDLAESDEPTSPSSLKVKTTRSTKVLKSSSPSSPISSFSAEETPKAKKAVAIKKALSESRESSEQPETDGSYPSRTPGHTNVTHPRRAAQNRAAQRTFRNRRKAYIKELEVRVSEIDKTRELMEAVQAENREIWRRFQMLENLVSSNGLQLPAFPPMTSLAATTLSADGVSSISVVTGNEYGLDNTNMMMLNHPNHLGHSDNE